MKTILRAYKYRLYPTEQQKVLIEKHFGCCRMVYNLGLEVKQAAYAVQKKSIGFSELCAQVRDLKQDLPWLKEVNAQSLQSALRDLDAAYQGFFKGRGKFPRYKKKVGSQSYQCPQNVKVDFGGNTISIPKFRDGIHTVFCRKFSGEVRTVTVSRTPTGKYFVAILVKELFTPVSSTGKSCGIDLGLKEFAVTSDGVRFENNRHTLKYEKRLTKAQRHLSRKKKGSSNWKRQKLKVARVHEKITNARHDLLHKISTQIINEYDIICVEDLNVKGMVQNGKLSKHISDASWGHFVRFLEYKAVWNGKRLVKIDRWFPSSKTCNICGTVNSELTLNERDWICCNGHLLDRDLNAAKNILKEGLSHPSVGLVEYRYGGDVRPLGANADEVLRLKNHVIL